MAKKLYSFRLEEEIIEKLKKIAERENRTLTNIIETLLIEKSKEKKMRGKLLQQSKKKY